MDPQVREICSHCRTFSNKIHTIPRPQFPFLPFCPFPSLDLFFHVDGKYALFAMGLFKRLVFLAALFCNGVAAQSFASVLTEAPQCAVSHDPSDRNRNEYADG
ncbi:hypothetical protein FCULG_00000141 [Fusarium culmorum]|uniref:Uncharacterized protein n=1 Tax=Fusarium culmorum TaxID=5516 RepID=A0A2T4GR28_FUSCU|nr:hypothetical protein FCULG_00000141 [Fusarium culmorum]